VIGERSSIRSGYRWGVFANFICNTSAVRVGVRKMKRGADRLAKSFAEANKQFGCEYTYSRLLHGLMQEATAVSSDRRTKRT
jgi:hypothetical protein